MEENERPAWARESGRKIRIGKKKIGAAPAYKNAF